MEPVADQSAWRVRQEATEVAGLAVVGKTFVLTTGNGRLERALAGLSSQPPEGMGSGIRGESARPAVSPDNTAAVFLSVPTLLKNFPILNLWKAIAGPAKRLGEIAVYTRLSKGGVDGEVMITLPPPPPPSEPAAGATRPAAATPPASQGSSAP